METTIQSNSTTSPVSVTEVAGDLLKLLDHGMRSTVAGELASLRDEVSAMASRAASGNGGAGGETNPEQVKSMMTQVFIDSGLLEALVRRVVTRELEAAGGTGGGVSSGDQEQLRSFAKSILKDFLAENLETIFKTHIEAVVEKSIADFLSSERVKELIDEKFRAVTLYMKTEIIPKAVQQALSQA